MNIFLSGFFVAMIIVGTAHAQGDGGSGQITGRTRKAILTAVPFLGIGPDARAASLGESGVATSPDINAVYWNSAKLTFIEGKPFGASLSYAPWLARVINDMSIAYLTAYYQITKEQAVAFSLKYFNLGDIQFTDAQARNIGIGFPTEYAIGVTYSRKLTQNMGVGVSLKYIASNLLTDYRQAGGGGNADAIAFNLSWYYTKELFLGTRPYTYSLGVNISDIGNRISYVDNPAPNQLQYLPANLRIGGAFGTELDPYNSLTLSLDFNKLLVPTPGESGFPEERSYLSSVFGSLADAPGGAREEFQEITISTGLEYNYNNVFAARAGYFYENPEKGGRQYYSLGFGLMYQQLAFDFAYWISPTDNNPLAETLRFTLSFSFERDVETQESITDKDN